jgi:hypothetical protein
MTDPILSATLAAAALIGLVIVTLAALKAWRDWLDLQRLGLQDHGYAKRTPANPSGARIELADLKERVRKLEAIAAGVDF